MKTNLGKTNANQFLITAALGRGWVKPVPAQERWGIPSKRDREEQKKDYFNQDYSHILD